MSNRKAVANFESTQVIGIIEKTATITSTAWVDADRMRAMSPLSRSRKQI